MKAQAPSSLEPPLEYNQDQMPLMNQGSLWPFQPSCELQKYFAVSSLLVLERKTGKKIPESSRLESSKILVNNFALSDVKDNTSGPLNRGGIVDLPCWEYY